MVGNKREETAGLSMAMRFPVQCSACQSGEKFKTNAGKRLCCAVLLRCAVECCVVLLWCVCVCVCGVGVTFFAHFPEKNALPSKMFAFRSL